MWLSSKLLRTNKLNDEDLKDREDELAKIFQGDVDMARYLSQSTFDPIQEILKEKNIQNFFKQKYNILMMYLEGAEENDSNQMSGK